MAGKTIKRRNYYSVVFHFRNRESFSLGCLARTLEELLGAVKSVQDSDGTIICEQVDFIGATLKGKWII